MVGKVQEHIQTLNMGYQAELGMSMIKYYNSYASFIDEHTVQLDNGKKVE